VWGVMPLAKVLRDFRDGDEHGWDTEFRYLRKEHGDSLAALSRSVRESGICEPIHLGSDGRVWDGHHRLCVATDLGLRDVPVRFA
jgi:hypothetical protein